MRANGCSRFSRMILLWVGGSEVSDVVWAFELDGHVYCFTSLQRDTACRDPGGLLPEAAYLSRRIPLSRVRFEEAFRNVAEVAPKGDYSLGATGRFMHGRWLHVAAYDRNQDWFLRGTIVEQEMLAAVNFLADLEVFRPEDGRAVTLNKARDLLRGIEVQEFEPVPEGPFENRVGIFPPDLEHDPASLLRRIERDWPSCVPFLVGLDLASGRP